MSAHWPVWTLVGFWLSWADSLGLPMRLCLLVLQFGFLFAQSGEIQHSRSGPTSVDPHLSATKRSIRKLGILFLLLLLLLILLLLILLILLLLLWIIIVMFSFCELRIVGSRFPGRSLGAWEFHPLRLRVRLSQIL